MPHPCRVLVLVLLVAWAASPATAQDSSLRGTFLVAAPQLTGTPFERSVILVIEHGAGGAHGLIVNRPTEATLADVLPTQKMDGEHDYRLHMGGPVRLQQLALLVRAHDGDPVLDQVLPDVAYATAADAVDAILAASPEPDRVRAFAGYAGWAPDQLEHEIQRGDWHVVPAQAGQVFAERPETLWRDLYDQVEGGAGGEPLQHI